MAEIMYLLDCGMFGEKWICETCRREHYFRRPILDTKARVEDPESTYDTCDECWV